MKHLVYVVISAVVSFVGLAPAAGAAEPLAGFEMVAEEPNEHAVTKAVHWASNDGTIDVFLVQEQQDGHDFRLFVVGGHDIEVVYRTKINSVEDVVRVLQPIEPASGCAKQYRIHHFFSRTTIWMAIELRQNGEHLDSLTRTFYGSMDKVVPDHTGFR